MIPAVIAAVLLSAVLLVFVIVYNRLVRQRNLVADGWAGIDVQLTRRADLVPNLVEVVKAYQVHERETFEEITEARAQLQSASGPAESGKADARLEGSLRTLVATAEAYPDLNANENFLDLQRQLSEIEEDVAFARDYYNATVRKYNTSQQVFPVVLVAKPLGFHPVEYFRADAMSRTAPRASE